MSYITKSVTIIITLTAVSNANSNPYPEYDYYSPGKVYTRNVTLKQGVLQGVVTVPKRYSRLSLVEVYRGIPYAAPPLGELRYMPTRGAPSWFGVKRADSFGPVCPQRFPDEKDMPHFRREAFSRLKEYLQDQSEDCLYLNIYTPFRGKRGIKLDRYVSYLTQWIAEHHF